MAAESVSIDQWLYTTLSGDSTLAGLVGTRIYPDVAPESATYPLIIYRMPDSTDVNELGGVRGVVLPDYQVFGVGQTESYLAVKPIADAIDRLLHAATGSADGVSIFQCLRHREHRSKGYSNGRGYCQLGGVYALMARSQE